MSSSRSRSTPSKRELSEKIMRANIDAYNKVIESVRGGVNAVVNLRMIYHIITESII